MTNWHRIAIVAIALVATLGGPLPAPSAPPDPDSPPARVSRRAWAATGSAQQAGVIVAMAGFPDLSAARALPTKAAKTRFVVETLLRHAQKAQAGLRRDLDARGVPYQVLWINNSLFIPAADRDTLHWLSARPDVVSVDLDVQMRGVQAGIQSSESRVQNPALNTQHSALNTQHSALRIQNPKSPIHRMGRVACARA